MLYWNHCNTLFFFSEDDVTPPVVEEVVVNDNESGDSRLEARPTTDDKTLRTISGSVVAQNSKSSGYVT